MVPFIQTIYQVNPFGIEPKTCRLRADCSANWAMDSWFGMKESNLRQPGQSRSLYHWANPESLLQDLTYHTETTKSRSFLVRERRQDSNLHLRDVLRFFNGFQPYPLHCLQETFACFSTRSEERILFKVRNFISLLPSSLDRISPFRLIPNKHRGGYPDSLSQTPYKINNCLVWSRLLENYPTTITDQKT